MKRFKSNWRKYSLEGKMAFLGSFTMMAGLFLPWYKDVDNYDATQTFLGISGPLYLAGLFIGSAALIGIFIGFNKLSNRSEKFLGAEYKTVYIAQSFFAIFMTILAASVYFHPKFGFNLLEKEAGVGMYLTFFSAVTTLFSGLKLNSAVKTQGKVVLEKPISQKVNEVKAKKDQTNEDIKKDINKTVQQLMTKVQSPETRMRRNMDLRNKLEDKNQKENIRKALSTSPEKHSQMKKFPKNNRSSRDHLYGNSGFNSSMSVEDRLKKLYTNKK